MLRQLKELHKVVVILDEVVITVVEEDLKVIEMVGVTKAAEMVAAVTETLDVHQGITTTAEGVVISLYSLPISLRTDSFVL